VVEETLRRVRCYVFGVLPVKKGRDLTDAMILDVLLNDLRSS
jgi:hypothetical protein